MHFMPIVLLLLGACQVHGKAVFAHFMVSNSENYTESDWANDFTLALDAHIDAFAMNMAYGDPVNSAALPVAFTVADSLGFRLFFSFDYAGNGAWPEDQVLDYLTTYGSNAAYYQHNGQPLVSTFEGPDNADDWVTIKAETNCFLIPDWSSLGAKAAMAKDVADGLMSWAAWPWGGQEMNTYVDASYRDYLNGLPYMMPVSPWFYTNLPGYNKNWMWRSDNLWYDRWQEIWFLQPEFVEILTWNDYGESHYIGPLYDKAMAPMYIGQAPFNYVENMPHDGWRLFLPFVIDMYKSDIATVTEEGLVTWFRPQPVGACDDGQTTINTASQLQIEFEPASVLTDEIFFSALLGSTADVLVSVGGNSVDSVSWTHKPSGGVGIYHGSVAYTGSGPVLVTVIRDGVIIAQVSEGSITSACDDGFQNWNAWVGSSISSTSISAQPPSLANDTCVEGTGTGNFAGLCEFSCRYGYCPIGACYCTKMGTARTLPNATSTVGYPAAGEDANYSGLCSFSCNYGYCPESACGTVDVPLSTPTSSPFTPLACVVGEGEGNLGGLCLYACNFGYCPIHSCTCTAEGVLIDAPAVNSSLTGVPAATVDYDEYHGLCSFACSRGYCPEGACVLSSTAGSGTTDNGIVVYIDPGVWSNPEAACPMPCTMVLPEIQLGGTSIIKRPPYTTTVVVEWTTVVGITQDNGDVSTATRTSRVAESTVIPLPDITTTAYPVSNLVIPTGGIYFPTPRLPPTTVTIADDPNPLNEPGVTHAPKNRTIIIPPYPWDTTPYGSSGSTDDLNIPKPPSIDVTDGPNNPECESGCSGKLCNDPFCHCFWGCPHTGASYDSDTSSDPDDPDSDTVDNGPDPNANNDDTDTKQTATTTTTSSCTRQTVTDAWVSCTSVDSTSSSCTTTSTLVEVGCSVTAMTTTTGVAESCYSVSPDDDQGQDGGAWNDSVLSSISSGWSGLGSALGITITEPTSTYTDVVYSGTASVLTTTATATATSTSTALPEYGSSSAWALFIRQVYDSDTSSTGTFTYTGLDYNKDELTIDHCTTDTDWSQSVDDDDEAPSSVSDITAFGASCSLSLWENTSYTSLVGKLECDKYADATCETPINVVSGGTCGAANIYQTWIVSCFWGDV
ncbi:uncharacterized protein N7482_001533 [Penicillium canariense]|uniref:Glycosyl hydrolase family 71-domain-containing protein n=1 Tax=Penicillium canariense TaxID=189055 RepID=A0A9W9LT65_9EURO|nr:uncharacterized protein N7482_001533 [Penicillium canariense]KAJ5175656.1 hypothetical protein N7482_001533 [Penicillium canariense]